MTDATLGSRTAGESGELDGDAVADRIAERAAAHRERELQRAFDRLAARDALDDERRRALASLADALTEGVLAGPRTAIERADDPDTLTVALDVFGRDE
ncbi:MAG: hypothetical protein ABEJ80_09000 [Halarchaeum sp.]